MNLVRPLWWLVALLAVLCSGPCVAGAPPADPRGLTEHTLANGLRLWIHPTDPAAGDQVGFWLVVRAGVLSEPDGAPGAAYLAKRAAGLGTASAPSDALDGLATRFGRTTRRGVASAGAHSLLSHDAVVYTLVADAGDASARGLILAHYADLLGSWAPDDGAVERARALAAERAGSMNAEERARRLFMADLFGDHPLGDRQLVPSPERAAGTGAKAVRAFVRACYRPERAVLIVVGPVDAGETIGAVRAALEGVERSGGAPGLAETPAHAGIGGRVSAHAVAGYEPAEVALLSVGPLAERAADRLEESVLDAVAAELVGVRARGAAPRADAGVRSVDAAVRPWAGGRVAEVSVRVDAEGLGAVGRAVGAVLGSVAVGGFTPGEVRDARAAVLAGYERRAAAWGRAGPAEVVEALAVAAIESRGRAGVGWVAPAEMAATAARVLSSATDEALAERARAVFAPDGLACILLAPDSGASPTPADARAVLNAARAGGQAVRADVPATPGRLGAPGRVAEVSHDATTDAWTAVLSNGVVVRAKRVAGADRAMVRVTVADGAVREDERTFGRTVAAAAAWRYPRTDGADASEVRAWSLDRGVSFKAVVADELLGLEVEAADPGGAADALTLAACLLASPGVDHAYTARVRTESPEPSAGLRRLGALLLDPADPRSGQPASGARVDPVAADRWLSLLAGSPLEVSVVGDFAPEQALRHAAETLGSLPARAVPSRERPRAWTALARAETVHRITGPSPEAVLGVVFADAADLGRVRPMTIAARAIDAELERARAESGLGGKTGAWVWQGDGIPDRATLVVRWEGAADPERAMEAIDRAVRRVANGGADAVLAKEIGRARASVAEVWSQARFWSDRLARLSVHGLDVGALASMPVAYDAMTPESVRSTLAKCVAGGVHKRVLVTPDP